MHLYESAHILFISTMFSRLATFTLTKNAYFNRLFRTSIQRMSENVTGPVMGIDLGTTNSCVAVMEGSDPRVIVNAEGHRTTPSVVAFTEDNQVLVGEPAKRQAVMNSKNTVYGTKRLIGRPYSDPEVHKELKHLPFELTQSNTGNCYVKARGKDYSPSQIGSYILTKMKETACSYLGMECKNAVITVPAYFNDSQRQATKDAGTIAGLNVVRIINEPTAAALAYGLQKKDLKKTIAVFDLGGGTFDISILEINEGVFEVKSTNGDTRLGGEDFDNVIMKYLVDNINKALKTDITQDLKALQRVRESAEKLKIELSHTHETEVSLPYIIGANSYSCKIRRSQLEDLVMDLIQRTIPPCKQALKDAGLNVNQLDEVILVGGMTRMPKVQQTVKEFFQREPSKNVNPDEAVAMGAAIQGGIMVGSVSGILLVDVTPYSLGVETIGNVFSAIIDKNTIIPTRKSQTYTTSQDHQTRVDIKVYQGNRGFCKDNYLLGEFNLGPFPARPRGATQIEVTFELDNNGICKVSAIDAESGVKVEGTVKSNPSGLSKEELDKMAKDAEKFRDEDDKRKQITVAKTELESSIVDLKRLFDSNTSKFTSEETDKLTKILQEAESLLRDTTDHPAQKYRTEHQNIINELVNVRRRLEEINKDTSTSSKKDSSNTNDDSSSNKENSTGN